MAKKKKYPGDEPTAVPVPDVSKLAEIANANRKRRHLIKILHKLADHVDEAARRCESVLPRLVASDQEQWKADAETYRSRAKIYRTMAKTVRQPEGQ